jgi:hypothetical protein
MTKHLFIGGVVAAGFDPTGAYLLVVSHSGRGVFATTSWERVARDSNQAYPENGQAIGIGPIAGVSVQVKEKNYESGALRLSSPDGKLSLEYEDGTFTVTDAGA